MNLIHRLNKFIVVPVLLEWLTPLEFCCLDSALCNHVSRVYLIFIVKEYSSRLLKFILTAVKFTALNAQMLNWFESRLPFVEIMNHFPLHLNIESLDLLFERDDSETKRKLLAFLSSARRISLDLTGAYDRDTVIDCFKILNNIESISLEDSENYYNWILSLSVIPTCFNQLRVLTLSGFKFCEEKVICGIVRSCKHLTDLDVGDCFHMSREFLTTLTVHGRKINRLLLSKCKQIKEREFLMYCMSVTIGLERMSLPPSIQFEIAMRTFLWYCGSLLDTLQMCLDPKYLGLSLCFEEMFVTCPRLSSLNIISVNRSLPSIQVESWNRFRALHLKHVDSGVFRTLLAFVFANCLSIEEFYISGDPDMSSAQEYPPITVFKCRELSDFRICGVVLTGEYHGMLTQSTKFRKISLCPRSWRDISNTWDDSAVTVGPCLRNLEDFEYAHCPSQECFESLLGHCLHLKVLRIPWKCRIPDESVFLGSVTQLTVQKLDSQSHPDIWLRCPNLRHLEFKSVLLNEEALAFIENLSKLRFLKGWLKRNGTWIYLKIFNGERVVALPT